MIESKNVFSYENKIKLNYLLDLPENYYENENETFPVILFLHGIGERGSDLSLIKKYGIHRYLKDMDIPFVVISPQCSENNFWDMHFSDIEKLLKGIENTYRIDKSKICLIGISLGAFGAWNFLMQRPNLFSSIVSVAGGSMLPKYSSWIKDIPAYIAHGEKDNEVNINESLEIYKALSEVNQNVTLKTYPNMGHELCTKIFEEEELYKWISKNI